MSAPSPTEVVRAFCGAFARRDIDELLGFLTDDCVYHNIPVDPVQGHDAIRTMLGMFVSSAIELEFQLRNVAADGPVVLTERVDRFVYPHVTIELPVMGTFEVADGKIAVWRDYFDLDMYMSCLQGEGA